MVKKPPLNEVVKAFSLNKAHDEWVRHGAVGGEDAEGPSEQIRQDKRNIKIASVNVNMRTSEHTKKTTELVYFSARIPLEVRNAIRSVSVHRKNLGLSPASEQDITKAALLEWLDRNK